MEWKLLEKEKPVNAGTYLVCVKTENGFVVTFDQWAYSIIVIRENHDEMLCSKIWGFTKIDVVFWGELPKAPV